MTDKITPKNTAPNTPEAPQPVVKPAPTVSASSATHSGNDSHQKSSVIKKKKAPSGALYGFVTFVVLTGTALVVWQGDYYDDIKKNLPDLPKVDLPAIALISGSQEVPTTAQAPIASSEELSRFRIVKQELTELRTSHEALAKNFLDLQKEFAAYKASKPVASSDEIEVDNAPQPPAAVVAPAVETPVAVAPTPAVDNTANESAIAALNARIDSLQTLVDSQSGVSQTRLQLLETLGAIHSKLNAGLPYKDELQTLKTIVGKDSVPRASIFTLQQSAEQGVPSLSDLTTDFEEIAREVVPASLTAQQSASFGDKMRSSFGSLINIRRVDVDESDSTDEADIARAEAELRAGNIEMTLTHLNQLTETSKAAFSQWIVKANYYLDTRSALGTVREIWLPSSKPSKSETE